MKSIFAINICVATSGHDRYDKVAINKHPIVVIGTKEMLRETLTSSQVEAYIKKSIPNQEVRSTAEFFVREILNESESKTFSIPVTKIIKAS